nr:hypothetical protein [Sedimentibacter sp.]
MLIGLMRGIGNIYYFTWFIWPFVFVFSLVDAIASSVKGDELSPKSSIWASVSLLIILAGVTANYF